MESSIREEDNNTHSTLQTNSKLKEIEIETN